MEFISPESCWGRDQRFGHDDRVEIPTVYNERDLRILLLVMLYVNQYFIPARDLICVSFVFIP